MEEEWLRLLRMMVWLLEHHMVIMLFPPVVVSVAKLRN